MGSEARIEPPCCTLGHSCACKTHARLIHKLQTQYKVGQSLGLTAAEVKKKLQTKPEHNNTSLKRNEYCVKDVDEIMCYIGGEDKPPVQKGKKKKHKKHKRVVKPSKEAEKESLPSQKTYCEIAKKDNIIENFKVLEKEQENQDDSTEPSADGYVVKNTEIESSWSEKKFVKKAPKPQQKTLCKKPSKPPQKNIIKKQVKKPSLGCAPIVPFKSGKAETNTHQSNQYLESGNNSRPRTNRPRKAEST